MIALKPAYLSAAFFFTFSFSSKGAEPPAPSPASASQSENGPAINLLEAVAAAQSESARDASVPSTPSQDGKTTTTVTSPPPSREGGALFVSAPTAAAASLSSPVAAGEERMPSLMKFEKMKLGNVARILAARLNVPVTIEAKADAPITGDYSNMDLRKALADVAAQAGLVVVTLGKNNVDGFTLVTPSAVAELDRNPQGAVQATMLVAQPAVDPENLRRFLLDAARKRAILLKERQALLDAEQRLLR